MSEEGNLKLFIDGIFIRNPLFALFLGLCPALAITKSVENSVGMGIATTAVLLFSCITVSLIRRFIPEDVRIPAFIVIIASGVTIVRFFMEAYFPPLYERLGIYIPLIVVNCIVLGRVLAFAYRNDPLPSFFDALGTGFGFALGLIVIGFVRELLGEGGIRFMGASLMSIPIEPVGVMTLAPGALLTMGVLLAFINVFRRDA